ncbi:MAG: AraC family transcriptional regulator [Lachnospiraceae bacterium]|nr:AraC family transcriptional regulator [Lachnospiraceae bacterium]
MEWIDRLNKAIEYIEDNLDGEINYEYAARIACCSAFHFQRMFGYMAGVPLSEYIRRRRMTLAAFDLQATDIKIIDLAMKYGYDSPTAFNRAFRNIHGTAPSKARLKGMSLKAFSRISFTIFVKGDAQMNYKIEKKEAIRIVGVKKHMDMSIEECFEEVPRLWQKTTQSGEIPQIMSLLNEPPFGLLGVSTCMNGKDFDYYIAVATDKKTPSGMEEYEIPAGTWAVFECVGSMPQAIQELQKRIVAEWLPTSGYEYANAPDIEVYFEGDIKSPEYRSEVWLPIVKKEMLP